VLSVASNPGHCLWSGIVPRERAPRVVARLMQPDMWSGWGIRTLSSRHPAFNPFSYQNGSVWPHDNSLIALGMKRYGFAAQAGEVARAIVDAASYFMSYRLPELFAGTDRSDLGFPQRYLGANVPQAWATGTAFALVQALIGYQPDAPHGRLTLDPTLPDWLPELEIRNLRLGEQRLDLRLRRDADTTRVAVTRGDPRAVVTRPMGIPADDFAAVAA
jgi:glycogen debranching enzyme